MCSQLPCGLLCSMPLLGTGLSSASIRPFLTQSIGIMAPINCTSTCYPHTLLGTYLLHNFHKHMQNICKNTHILCLCNCLKAAKEQRSTAVSFSIVHAAEFSQDSRLVGSDSLREMASIYWMPAMHTNYNSYHYIHFTGPWRSNLLQAQSKWQTSDSEVSLWSEIQIL